MRDFDARAVRDASLASRFFDTAARKLLCLWPESLLLTMTSNQVPLAYLHAHMNRALLRISDTPWPHRPDFELQVHVPKLPRWQESFLGNGSNPTKVTQAPSDAEQLLCSGHAAGSRSSASSAVTTLSRRKAPNERECKGGTGTLRESARTSSFSCQVGGQELRAESLCCGTAFAS